MPHQSYDRRTRPLLKVVGGKPRDLSSDPIQGDDEETTLSSTGNKKPTSWKDGHPTVPDHELQRERSDSDISSDDGRSADIKRSKFNTNANANNKIRKQSPTEKDSGDKDRTKRSRIGTLKSAGTQSSSRSAPSTAQDRHDAIFPNPEPKKAKTYGAPKQTASFMRNRHQIDKASSRKPKQEPPLSKPIKSTVSNPSGFQLPTDLLPDLSPEKKKQDRYEVPEDEEDDRAAVGRLVDVGTPDKTGRMSQTFDFPSDSDGDRPTETKAQRKTRLKRKREERKSKKGLEKRGPSPPKAEFMDFDDDMDFNAVAKEVGMTNIQPTQAVNGDAFMLPTDLLESEPEDFVATPVKATVCPWCDKPVPPESLKKACKGGRMGVRAQQRFCRSHTKASALEQYRAKQYPIIHWDELPIRIEAFYDDLLPIINNTAESHYRAKLAEKIASGTDRAMKSEDNLNPGYYGPKGYNLMCEILVEKYGKLLKEKAVEDRVISGRGSAYFIQSVLVAELASRLVKEDMDMSLEKAREVLEESREIGEMVNEDEG